MIASAKPMAVVVPVAVVPQKVPVPPSTPPPHMNESQVAQLRLSKGEEKQEMLDCISVSVAKDPVSVSDPSEFAHRCPALGNIYLIVSYTKIAKYE